MMEAFFTVALLFHLQGSLATTTPTLAQLAATVTSLQSTVSAQASTITALQIAVANVGATSPCSISWRLSGTFPVVYGTDTFMLTGPLWSVFVNYCNLSTKITANSAGEIVFPIKGVYAISASARFDQYATSVENDITIAPRATQLYGSNTNTVSNLAIRLSASEGYGGLVESVSFTGIFFPNDAVAVTVWSNIGGNTLNGVCCGDTQVTVTLVQAL